MRLTDSPTVQSTHRKRTWIERFEEQTGQTMQVITLILTLFATAIAAFVGCIIMGLWANLPFALAPGMGLNAYFTFGVVIGLGVDW